MQTEALSNQIEENDKILDALQAFRDDLGMRLTQLFFSRPQGTEQNVIPHDVTDRLDLIEEMINRASDIVASTGCIDRSGVGR